MTFCIVWCPQYKKRLVNRWAKGQIRENLRKGGLGNRKGRERDKEDTYTDRQTGRQGESERASEREMEREREVRPSHLLKTHIKRDMKKPKDGEFIFDL